MFTGPKVTVSLQRRTRVSDGRGGSVDVWSEIEEFRCVLTPGTVGSRSGNEGAAYSKETVDADYALYAKQTITPIKTFDRIWFEGRIFDVKSVYFPVMNRKVMKLDLKEIL